MEQSRGVFQQKALDRLRSPEELDKLVSITTPLGWVTLAAILLLIFSGMIWAVFGVMATKVNGAGMIIDSNGVANIVPLASGKIVQLHVEMGARIHKGQVVATMIQPATGQDIARVRGEMSTASSIADMTGKAAQLDALFAKQSSEDKIVSSFDGVVTEQKVKLGQLIQAGDPIFGVRLDQEREDLDVVLYVPVLDGKKIMPGMIIQVNPGAVDTSEYGSLIARVNQVSEYPVSSESIYNWVGNKEMTNWITQRGGGAVVEVRGDLIKDKETASGYLWSSVRGSPDPITPGAACTGSIVVKREPPVAKAFRKLTNWLRSD
ncbi:HlyD family efflux transporter periplasmic adaptor subunit [Sporomusa malonica]|nr:HlyD family efflux transporter periplasmic adaptor subunit [Sporomusa malonica]